MHIGFPYKSLNIRQLFAQLYHCYPPIDADKQSKREVILCLIQHACENRVRVGKRERRGGEGGCGGVADASFVFPRAECNFHEIMFVFSMKIEGCRVVKCVRCMWGREWVCGEHVESENMFSNNNSTIITSHSSINTYDVNRWNVPATFICVNTFRTIVGRLGRFSSLTNTGAWGVET